MARKIMEKVPRDVLMADLEKYRQKAIELGATDAKIIPSNEIIIDERVRLKCTYPKCRMYGTNANCPPYSVTPAEIREVLKKYQYAIFCMMRVPFDGILSSNDDLYASFRLKINEIVSKIEAMAFHEGYYFATGFASGSCKHVFCEDLECAVLTPGQKCRAELKARSSMEAVGIDCFLTATKVGWDIFPIGKNSNIEDIPCGRLLGLILIH